MRILDGHDAAQLTATPDHSRVTGARVANRESGEEQTLTADLVVDATGRGSRTPAFLESSGYDRSTEDHVIVRTAYASQLLRIDPGTVERVVGISAAPGRPTGMVLLGYEDNTWMFTVFGMVGREPPGDLSGMLSFAQDCGPAHVLAAVRAAAPLGDVSRHRVPSSQWRRYDKMRRFPDGLLVTGDAICSFNPVYGQGMTVAALEALALSDCLSRGTHKLPKRFFRAAAKPIRLAWHMSASGDLNLPEVDGRRSLSRRLTGRCADWVLSACESDAGVVERFFRVNNFVDSPARLLHPSFVFRVATVNLRGRRRRQRAAAASEAARDSGRVSSDKPAGRPAAPSI